MRRHALISSLIICVVFLVAISAPLFVAILAEDKDISVSEKRRLTKLPSMPHDWQSLVGYPKDYEKYFNDHYGFREQIVYLHNLLSFKLFGLSSHQMVTVGKNDWLFYNADGALYDYMGYEEYDMRSLELFSRILQDRKEWLASLGSRYLFVPVANKATVYSEYMPARIQRYRGEGKYEQIVGYLKNNSAFQDIIDTKQILIQGKDSGQIYARTDSHWNMDGVYMAYKNIIMHLQQWFPEMEPLHLAKTKQWIEPYAGDLSQMINLQKIIAERIPKSIVVNDCLLRKEKSYTLIENIKSDTKIKLQHYPVIGGCREKHRKAVMIHDSFGVPMRSLLAQHFNSIIYVNYFNFESIKALIEHERPDIVIDLRAARNLQKALIYDLELEERVLRKKRNRLADTRMNLSAETLDEYLELVQDLKISKVADGLALEIVGDSPKLFFKFDKGSGRTPLVVEVNLSAGQRAELFFYYLSEGDADFSYKQSMSRPIAKGINELLFRIPTPKPQGKIALVPGASEGVYTLHSFTIKREPGFLN